jgi:pyruvate/2-oxoglutarate dehydrogenase complex dihydrolipoamide acyltransferase (E2) component
MICQNCRQSINPVDHNHRGPRCPMCWERVVIEEEKMPPDDENPKIDVTDGAIKLANEHGIDLSSIQGSGADGRIVKRDVEALL